MARRLRRLFVALCVLFNGLVVLVAIQNVIVRIFFYDPRFDGDRGARLVLVALVGAMGVTGMVALAAGIAELRGKPRGPGWRATGRLTLASLVTLLVVTFVGLASDVQ